MSVSINGTGGITFADASTQSTGGYTGFRNRIINGAMMIDQRNAGAGSSPNTSGTNNYPVDRFYVEVSQNSKIACQQNQSSVTPPAGFVNYLGITSQSAYSVLTGDYFDLSQRIEGYNIVDLGWGTVNAKSVTLSFQVYSSLTGTFGGALKNNAGNRSYPFTYSIPVANTWTPISITIAGDTTGTWQATNGIGINIMFGLGVGTTYSGTAGAWASGNYVSATGATSVVGTNGATFYITGVQLEKGSVATPFEFRPYGMELSLCQRYYAAIYVVHSNLPSTLYSTVMWPVWMRAAPTLTATQDSGGGMPSFTIVNSGKCIYQSSAPTGTGTALVTGNAEL